MKIDSKKWLWVLYPIIVVIFMAVSANYLLNNRERWTQVAVEGQETAEVEAEVATLSERLRILESIDVKRDNADLALMAKAVLPNRAIWLTVSEIKAAASESGVVLNGYKAGAIGDVRESDASGSAEVVEVENPPMKIEATLTVNDVKSVSDMIKNLEGRMPLVKITKINYQFGKVTMVVEGAWQAWTGGDSGLPLAEYRNQSDDVKRRLEVFNQFTRFVETGPDSWETVTNPF